MNLSEKEPGDDLPFISHLEMRLTSLRDEVNSLDEELQQNADKALDIGTDQTLQLKNLNGADMSDFNSLISNLSHSITPYANILSRIERLETEVVKIRMLIVRIELEKSGFHTSKVKLIRSSRYIFIDKLRRYPKIFGLLRRVRNRFIVFQATRKRSERI